MANQKYEKKYTKPDLREELKEEIKQSDKGGDPGQWSARKSQLLVQEYEKHGGGYKTNEKDDAAQSLEEWTEQNWQTQEGEGRARQDKVTKRYLPEEVWNRLSESEKKEAEQTKQQTSKSGEQYVEWTPAIKRAMEALGYSPDHSQSEPTKAELYEEAQAQEIEGRSQMSKAELQQAVQSQSSDQLADQTVNELYQRAQELEISGRSKMRKDELIEAIQKAEKS